MKMDELAVRSACAWNSKIAKRRRPQELVIRHEQVCCCFVSRGNRRRARRWLRSPECYSSFSPATLFPHCFYHRWRLDIRPFS